MADQVQARTVRPRATGNVRGSWHEQYGTQWVNVSVDSGRPGREFRVVLERRWGPQLGDNRTQDISLSREGAEILRDALDAALRWKPDA